MELMDLAKFLDELANYFVIVPIAFGLYFLKSSSTILRILLVGLILILVQFLFFKVVRVNSSFVFAYVIASIDVATFTILISETIWYKISRVLFQLTGFLILLFIPIDYLFITGLTNFGISTFVAKVFLAISTFLVASELFKINLNDALFKKPLIWICFGVILNNLVGSFDIFSVEIMNYSQALVLQYYTVWSLVKVLMYAFFSYSFYLTKVSIPTLNES